MWLGICRSMGRTFTTGFTIRLCPAASHHFICYLISRILTVPFSYYFTWHTCILNKGSTQSGGRVDECQDVLGETQRFPSIFKQESG